MAFEFTVIFLLQYFRTFFTILEGCGVSEHASMLRKTDLGQNGLVSSQFLRIIKFGFVTTVVDGCGCVIGLCCSQILNYNYYTL